MYLLLFFFYCVYYIKNVIPEKLFVSKFQILYVNIPFSAIYVFITIIILFLRFLRVTKLFVLSV